MTHGVDLTGQAVLVTGGTKGIGRVIAERFLDAGASVMVCARKPADDLPRGRGGEAAFVAADLREADGAAAVVDAAVERFGRLDVCVNNAGGAPVADAATMSPRLFASIVTLNLVAPFFVAQRANAVMQQQDGGGLIINIGSVTSLRPAPGTAPYGAAKAGLVNLTRALAVEWAPKVRVNNITVGLVRNEHAAEHYGGEDGVRAVDRSIPLGRMATPADVADTALLLTSPLAGYVTGADLVMDGGGETPAFLVAIQAAGAQRQLARD